MDGAQNPPNVQKVRRRVNEKCCCILNSHVMYKTPTFSLNDAAVHWLSSKLRSKGIASSKISSQERIFLRLYVRCRTYSFKVIANYIFLKRLLGSSQDLECSANYFPLAFIFLLAYIVQVNIPRFVLPCLQRLISESAAVVSRFRTEFV